MIQQVSYQNTIKPKYYIDNAYKLS